MRVTPNPAGFNRLRSMAEALKITPGDYSGPVLVVLGRVHRAQEKAIFASQGGAGASGRWAPLEPRYAARKRKAGGGKILVFTGEMKRRFISPTSSYYIQRFVAKATGGVFQFGAASDVAAAHFYGEPSLAPRQSARARKLFGGMAPRLPVRDMISKTPAQVKEFTARFVEWYRKERILNVLRGARRLGR